MTAGLGLHKTLRIAKRREYLAMRGPGSLKAWAGPFTAVARPNGLGRNRLGVTVTRKVGKAVVRNRLKRAAREFFRLHQGEWPQGLDLLLIARPDPGQRPKIGPGGHKRLADLLAKAAAPPVAESAGEPGRGRRP
jgi:ribonuclease P protein component